jgi:glycosyltransferase involved in cell wall biosynthesis
MHSSEPSEIEGGPTEPLKVLMPGNSQRWIALLGRRDEPTDGVADYCAWFGRAAAQCGYEFETVRVDWAERGWRDALAELQEKAAAWRGHWVLLQHTTLAWSRRGFPWQAPRILSVLQKSGVHCGVVFHDFWPFVGKGMIGRAREYCQFGVLKRLYAQADRAIFTIEVEKISWLPSQHEKAVFIPVGANCPEPPLTARVRAGEARTVAVYGVTGGAHIRPEVADIGFAMKRAGRTAGRLRLVVVGRGSKEAEPALRQEFSGTNIVVEALGLMSAEDLSQTLASMDVQLFVRNQISSRRGSAIAGIACGLPIVCYAGPETGWPVTEAGIVAVPLGDREALSVALERVLVDDELRASLAERSRRAQEQYFSWRVIAARYADALGGPSGGSSSKASAVATLVARTR